jgi:serine/threonine-protein kinase
LGYETTGHFTWRRARSAFGSWRASIKARDVVAASLVFLLSLGIGGYMLSRAQTAAHLAFANEAQRLLGNITEKLSEPSEDLTALKTFFEVSGTLNRNQFRQLTAPMLKRHLTVLALEWLPLVKDADRAAYEQEARAAGLSDYRFWELGADGKPRDASRRAFYAPVHFMEPPKAMALGFDIASEPGRWSNAERAGVSGKVAVSDPFNLVQDAGNSDASQAIGMYAPVYRGGDPETEAARRESLLGFAMAIFRVAPLIESASSAARRSDLAFALRDTDEAGATLLAEWPPETEKISRRRGFDLRMPLPFQDRHWMLEALPLPGAFRPARRTPIGVGIAGVLVSLLGFVIVTSLRTISRLRRQAEKVGPYRLISRLGQGAMGVVWEARHALLRRPTAVKLLAPGTGGERALARFEREVQLTASLTHPSTIAIYDYGRNADGIFYYAMEQLRGINLGQLVAFEGPLPAARVVHLLRQACGALTEAHAAGLIHRDIKPANLMVCVYGGIPDFLKVLDFGLVKDVGAVEPAAGRGPERETDQVELSQDGSLLGTPLYMAPEGMSDPAGVDRRADLFSLGAVGYFLLTGSSPFPGRTAIEVFAMERKGPPKSLPLGPPNPVPACLDAAIRGCLALAREDRPTSAEALDAMLEACAIAPPWTREDARQWWEEKGPKALESARARRDEEDSSKVLVLASDGRTGG